MFMLAVLGFVGFSYLSVSRSPRPLSIEDSTSSSSPAIEMVVPSGLEAQINARMNVGRAGVQRLDLQASTLRNDLDRMNAARESVLDLRQRFSQARLQAEYEGHWPARAAGRSFDRFELKEMIDRTDQWLKRYDSVAAKTESRFTQCGMAIGQAERVLLSMQRMIDNLRTDTRRDESDEYAARQGAQNNFQNLSVQLDQILNDSALKAPRPTLQPFDFNGIDHR